MSTNATKWLDQLLILLEKIFHTRWAHFLFCSSDPKQKKFQTRLERDREKAECTIDVGSIDEESVEWYWLEDTVAVSTSSPKSKKRKGILQKFYLLLSTLLGPTYKSTRPKKKKRKRKRTYKSTKGNAKGQMPETKMNGLNSMQSPCSKWILNIWLLKIGWAEKHFWIKGSEIISRLVN